MIVILKTRELIEKTRRRYADQCLSQEDINCISKAQNLFDGVKAVMLKRGENRYSFVNWDNKDDEKVMQAIYEMEQVGGFYKDNKQEFMDDWKNGEYEPDGIITFEEDQFIKAP